MTHLTGHSSLTPTAEGRIEFVAPQKDSNMSQKKTSGNLMGAHVGIITDYFGIVGVRKAASLRGISAIRN